MRETVSLAIDDQFDLALGPSLDRLAAMLAGFAKAELAKPVRKIARLGLIDREFKKADTAAPRLRRENIRRSLRALGRKAILQQDQRPQPVSSGARRRAGTKLVVEDFERERPRIAGGDHGFHEVGHGQIALTGKASEMPAPGEDVEAKLWRVSQLNQKYLFGRNRSNGGDRKRRRQRMEAVENDADRIVVGAAHDLPCIAIIVHMPSPCERFEADTQAAPGSQLAKFAKIGGGPVDTAERGRGYIAADQHHVEFPFGPGKIAGALRLGHALEIAKRLERANGETEIAA